VVTIVRHDVLDPAIHRNSNGLGFVVTVRHWQHHLVSMSGLLLDDGVAVWILKATSFSVTFHDCTLFWVVRFNVRTWGEVC
jgi:hypothetical protein